MGDAAKPSVTKLAFEKHWDDTGSVKAAVRYNSSDNESAIELMSVSEEWTATFPVSDIDWLIDCLRRIRAEIPND